MEKEKYNPEKILSKPIHGWSHFAFDEDMRVSYIDDVPIYLLEEIKNSLCNKKNFLVSFDSEGYEFTILSYDNYEVEVIIRKDEKKIITLEKNFKEFCYDIIYSIESDINDWSVFFFDNENEKNIKKSRNKIKNLIKEIKEIIPNVFWY